MKVYAAPILPKMKTSGRVLYYHYVFPENYRNFTKQIEYFKNTGFTNLDGDPQKFCVTFDDTYKLNIPVYEYLIKQNIPLTIFISPKAVSEQLDIYHGSKLKQLTIEDLHYLIELGVTIGNHTYEHGRYETPKEFIADTIRAQNWIYENLNVMPEHVAFPRGEEFQLSSSEWETLRKIGIKSALGTQRFVRDTNILGRHHIMPHWPTKTLEYFFGI